jgi:hypothetical protein
MKTQNRDDGWIVESHKILLYIPTIISNCNCRCDVLILSKTSRPGRLTHSLAWRFACWVTYEPASAWTRGLT